MATLATDLADGGTNKTRRRCSRETCRACGKKFLMLLFSHIGLTGLVVGYSVLGGVIFMKLESQFETREKTEIVKIRSQFIDELWDYTNELNVFYEPEWIKNADDVFKDFQDEIFSAVKEKGWDGTDEENSKDSQWTYAGSLLYAVTTITTIGYGHIAPKTPWGKVATIIYAMFGIPLTLLCLANIGKDLGKCFKFLYSRVMCGLCRRWERRHSRKLDKVSPESQKGETFSPDTKSTPKATRVPIAVTIAIMAGYIFGGATVFTLWEKDWDFLAGSYFCFITLSTIGFGDLVPGTALQSWSSQSKRVFCSLYLLFGLALVAMCFDLVQDEVRHICRRFAFRLGMIDEKKLQERQ